MTEKDMDRLEQIIMDGRHTNQSSAKILKQLIEAMEYDGGSVTPNKGRKPCQDTQ